MGDFLDADLDPERFPEIDPYRVNLEEEKVPPSTLDRWRRNTASGAIMGAVALGLQQVFDPEKKTTVAVEQEVPDRPDLSGRVELKFDPLDCRSTSVVIEVPDE